MSVGGYGSVYGGNSAELKRSPSLNLDVTDGKYLKHVRILLARHGTGIGDFV